MKKLQEEILEMMAKEISLAMDQAILDNIMIESVTKDGWTGTDINPAFGNGPSPELSDWYAKTAEWIHLNAVGDYQLIKGQWYFNNPKDATMFILRWS